MSMSTRHKHPEGALCAAGGFYPPLQSDGEAATIQRTALLHLLREAKSLPYSVESLHP